MSKECEVYTSKMLKTIEVLKSDFALSLIHIFENSREAVTGYMKELCERGAGAVVVTGLTENDKVGAGFYDAESGTLGFLFHELIPVYYPGTGDLFTSVLTSSLIGKDRTLEQAVSDAALFVKECAEYTKEQGTPSIEGVQFEKLLYKLIG